MEDRDNSALGKGAFFRLSFSSSFISSSSCGPGERLSLSSLLVPLECEGWERNICNKISQNEQCETHILYQYPLPFYVCFLPPLRRFSPPLPTDLFIIDFSEQ
jgi:hypothetical protein